MRQTSIKDILTEKISGEWGNEAVDGNGVVVIRTANFLNTGKINFSNLVRRQIDSKKVEKKKLISGDIIIEKSGGSPAQPVGRVVLFENPDGDTYLCNNFTTILRPDKNQVYPGFLFYVLHSNHKKGKTLRHQNKTTGIINLKLDSYLASEIILPPIDDQIRVAHLLGKVEGLIAQRKQHLQQLDDLLKSVFLEMFGDPVRNEKGWDIEPCDKAVLDISSGTSYGGEDRPFESAEEIGVLKISAVTKGTFDPTEFKVVNRAQITKLLRFVKRGDFLLSRANTVELVAACCVVPQDHDQLFLPDKLWVLTLDEQLVKPQFLNYLLKNERYRNVVRSLASGGHDSMLNISMKKFMTLGIPCPPDSLQNQFVAIVEKVESLKSRYQQSLTDLEALYGVLSQQAFKGELDLSRVPLPAQPVAPVSIGDQAIVPEPVVQTVTAIHLPDTGNLPAALENSEARKALIAEWLEAYRQQLGDAPFSVHDFMVAASDRLTEWLQAVVEDEAVADEHKNRLAESYPSNDVGLGVNDYEHIKKWVFEALAAGALTQGGDKVGNRIELTAIQS